MVAQQQGKTKSFECERMRVIYEDTLASLKRVQLENEKLSKKIEVLTAEFYALQAKTMDPTQQQYRDIQIAPFGAAKHGVDQCDFNAT